MTMATPPFAVVRLDHVVLRVRDLSAAEAFYRAALGCIVVRRRDDLGLVHLRAGASMIDLILRYDSLKGRLNDAASQGTGTTVDATQLAPPRKSTLVIVGQTNFSMCSTITRVPVK